MVDDILGQTNKTGIDNSDGIALMKRPADSFDILRKIIFDINLHQYIQLFITNPARFQLTELFFDL